MTWKDAIAAYKAKPTVLELQGAVQHYDWGGYEFIPALLGIENCERKPYAELWIGAHPQAPSTARIEGVSVTLDRLISEAVEEILGPEAARRFAGRLPYLFKVLDARKMLSIQAHPAKSQAEEGFARENAAGIPLQASHRSYRDDNHKPEVHVALTEFWMLHGFRPLEEIPEILDAVPELAPAMPDLLKRLQEAGQNPDASRKLLRALYESVMTMPQERVDSILDPLLERLQKEELSDKSSPDFWALHAAEEFPLPGGHRDRGIFSIYLLNLVHLKPGQGTFQPAGTLHAYLEGVNVELMVSSDNVLRGGLTSKHVNVPELMRILRFESGRPDVLEGVALSDTERVYRTPAEEFELSRIALAPGKPHIQPAGHGPDALLVLEGSLSVQTQDRMLHLERGAILLAPHSVGYSIESHTPSAVLFKASIPDER